MHQKCSAISVDCENVLCALKLQVRLFNARSTSAMTVGVWNEKVFEVKGQQRELI